ncbi:hypothetical protein TD95_002306 [Thielaviopsis punctulata]|uniref:lytic cellulose monooxygenase (C4-dehydrogenating) n=1 Tax=Thielaviopsis punctulata TaxID=72032 RepID=A0A0F4ZBU7_9PEZI|nr:hypothetical protein TD95_002306 [Thielaviopsis punctulata]
MKFTLGATILAALAPLASAHYVFDVLVVDGKESNSFQYIRSNTRAEKYNPTKWKNTRDNLTPDMNDFRCNLGSFSFASKTQTATVAAGAQLSVKLAYNAKMQHPGPAQVYMSKAPSSASSYQGDGKWFKIHQEAICDKSKPLTSTAWCTYNKDRLTFTVPKDIAPGEYLIRTEHIGLHGAHNGEAEFYYSCVQVKVTGSGSSTPSNTISFPGGYKSTDKSFNYSVWGSYSAYPEPGPAVYSGSSVASSSSVSSASSTTDESPEESTDKAAAAASSSVSCSSKTPYGKRHARDVSPQ